MRMTDKAWADVLAVNLTGAFNMTRAVMRPMIKARAGRIINMSSVSGRWQRRPGQLLGLEGGPDRAHQGDRPRGRLARHHGQRDRPGFVITELTDTLPDTVKDAIKAATPLGRFASVDEVAAAVAFLASDEAAYITGQVSASTRSRDDVGGRTPPARPPSPDAYQLTCRLHRNTGHACCARPDTSVTPGLGGVRRIGSGE